MSLRSSPSIDSINVQRRVRDGDIEMATSPGDDGEESESVAMTKRRSSDANNQDDSATATTSQTTRFLCHGTQHGSSCQSLVNVVRTVVKHNIPRTVSSQFTSITSIGYGIDTDFRPRDRNKMRREVPPFLRVADSFFHMSSLRSGILGAVLFLLLCLVPELARFNPSASSRNSYQPHSGDYAKAQKAWEEGQQTEYHPLSTVEISEILHSQYEANLALPLSNDTEKRTTKGFLGIRTVIEPTPIEQEPDAEASTSTWRDDWSFQHLLKPLLSGSDGTITENSHLRLSPPTLNPFAVAYSKSAKPWKIGSIHPDCHAEWKWIPSSQAQEADRTNPELIKAREKESSPRREDAPLAEEEVEDPSIPHVHLSPVVDPRTMLRGRALYDFTHNRHYYHEFQYTPEAWQVQSKVRRLKLKRDYTRFPSNVPAFLSDEPLATYDQENAALIEKIRTIPPENVANGDDQKAGGDKLELIPIPDSSRLFNPERIVVFYVFAYNHDEYMLNLESFIRDCVREHHEVDYIFLLNQIQGRDVELERLPQLPYKNARYIYHRNECFDWGTVGWFVDLQNELAQDAASSASGMKGGYNLDPSKSKYHIELDRYKYFILMNSSVRGPFFPSYIDVDDPRTKWWVPFIHRMKTDPTLKMVGPLINCQFNPHVQSYVLLLDQESFSLLRGTSSDKIAQKASSKGYWTTAAAQQAAETPASPVFQCHDTWGDAVNKAEIGASFSIIKSGYNLGSLTRAHVHLDFRMPSTQGCFAYDENPSQQILSGALVTSGPDAGHIQRQIELLVQHQNALYDKEEERLQLHDLEGDILTSSELQDQHELFEEQEKEREGSEEEDWNWAGEMVQKEQLQDLDLLVQLRVLSRVREEVLVQSVRNVLDKRSLAAAQLAAQGQSPITSADSLATQTRSILLPSHLLPHRIRPDLVSEASWHYQLDLQRDDIARVVDMALLKEVAEEALRVRSRSLSKEDEAKSAQLNKYRTPLAPEYDTPEPLPPSLMHSRVAEADLLVNAKSFSVDPLEVLFGKWKFGLQMDHIVTYERWRLAVLKRQLRNQHRRVRDGVDQWNQQNHHRWSEAWRRFAMNTQDLTIRFDTRPDLPPVPKKTHKKRQQPTW